MDLWQGWLVVGIVLLLIELLTFTLAFAAIALGALVAALAAYVGLEPVWQIAGLGVGTLIGFVGARPFVLKKLGRGDHTYQSNVDALLGQEGKVVEALDGHSTGRVLVGGEEWRAVPATGQPIEAGRSVTVVEVEGNKLVVVEFQDLSGG